METWMERMCIKRIVFSEQETKFFDVCTSTQ